MILGCLSSAPKSSKTNRHNKCKVLLSSQYLTDLQPQAIKQLDFVFMFKSFNEEKLKSMYELLDISIPFDQFITIYKFSTAEPFNFLFVDVRRDLFRKNFDILLDISTPGAASSPSKIKNGTQ